MNKIIFSKNELLVFALLLYLFSHFFYTLLPFNLSQLSFVLLFFTFVIINPKIRVSSLFFIIIGILLFIYSSFNEYPKIMDGIRWILFISIMFISSNSSFVASFVRAYSCHYRKVLFLIYILDCLLVFFHISKIGYNNAWQGNYFMGYCYSQPICAGIICYLASLKLVCSLFIRNVSYVFIFSFLIELYTVVQTGARTYIVPMLFILISLFVYIYKIKSNCFVTIVLFMPLLLVHFFLFGQNKFVEKSLNQATRRNISSDPLNAFFSGRLDFWSIDLKSYINSDFLNLITGNGFEFSYYVNDKFYGHYIWPHNDIVSTLLSVGIIGVIIYVIAIFFPIIKFTKCRFNYQFCGCLFFFFCVFFVLFMNGLYMRPYIYFSFIITYLFLRNFNKVIK